VPYGIFWHYCVILALAFVRMCVVSIHQVAAKGSSRKLGAGVHRTIAGYEHAVGTDAEQRSRPLEMEENRERFAEDDPRHHTIKIRGMLSDIRDHLREDIGKINEPRAEALFETTAETLDGLITAFEDYERGQEEAWRENT
jgi:hypothetical protein